MQSSKIQHSLLGYTYELVSSKRVRTVPIMIQCDVFLLENARIGTQIGWNIPIPVLNTTH